MPEQSIKQDRLGSLTKLGQGGQGVVYRAPNVTTKFADSMVFKEYKASARGGIDFAVLSAMPALVEKTLSYRDAERLISLTAWPCAMVQNASGTSGFVMPSIPESFFIPLKTVKGVSQTPAEYQHLLNEQSVLAARGINIDDAQRYALLREAASGLEFLHKIGICVGDISPKNVLFSLDPREAVYFIDCDAMRINGVSAMPQVETPGWEIPAGEELATVYADTYKLGLLALRLLAGDQDTRSIERIPARTPSLLRQIITDTLTKEPARRPLPAAWNYVLGHAVEEAQHRMASAPPLVPEPAADEPVQVRSRPKPAAAAVYSAPAAAPPSQGTSGAPSTDKRWIVGIISAAVVVLAIVLAITLGSGRNDSTATSSTRRATSTYSASTVTETSASTVTATRPVAPRTTTPAGIQFAVPPTLFNDADTFGDSSCRGGKAIPNGSGYQVARGSNSTSCAFAASVGAAYMAADSSPDRAYRQVFAEGTVPCSSVPTAACSGDYFVMSCSIEGSDRWVTCRGGREAVVYVF